MICRGWSCFGARVASPEVGVGAGAWAPAQPVTVPRTPISVAHPSAILVMETSRERRRR
jgi:hypothetical protein